MVFCGLGRYQTLLKQYQRMFPTLEVDVDKDLQMYEQYAELLRPMVKETVSYLNKAIKQGKKILVEGANAAMLDIDFGNS